MPIHLCVIYGCFHTAMAEVTCGDGDHLAAKTLNCLALYRKKEFAELWTSSTYHFANGEIEVQIGYITKLGK